MADGRRGDQRVEQAQAIREMKLGVANQSAAAPKPRWTSISTSVSMSSMGSTFSRPCGVGLPRGDGVSELWDQ
jgi:hypothetical protein